MATYILPLLLSTLRISITISKLALRAVSMLTRWTQSFCCRHLSYKHARFLDKLLYRTCCWDLCWSTVASAPATVVLPLNHNRFPPGRGGRHAPSLLFTHHHRHRHPAARCVAKQVWGEGSSSSGDKRVSGNRKIAGHRLTPTALDVLVVILHGWHHRLCMNWIWGNCKAIWLKALDHWPFPCHSDIYIMFVYCSGHLLCRYAAMWVGLAIIILHLFTWSVFGLSHFLLTANLSIRIHVCTYKFHILDLACSLFWIITL